MKYVRGHPKCGTTNEDDDVTVLYTVVTEYKTALICCETASVVCFFFQCFVINNLCCHDFRIQYVSIHPPCK